jgi:integrase
MNLVEFAHHYFENHQYGIKENSQKCYYLPAAKQFTEATGCDDVAKINRSVANQFVDWLKSRSITTTTQHTRRRAFVTLWKAAYDSGLCPVFEPCRKIRLVKRSPRAWSIDDVKRLVRVTKEDTREWAWRVSAGAYWASLFAAAWDTGLRLGDLLSIERDWILTDNNSGCGTLVMIASKTRHEHVCTLNPCTMDLINESFVQQPKRRLVWPLRSDRREFYRDVQKRFKAAGLTGTFRFLRRAAVTYAESQSPGLGTKLAGHRDSRTTRESYLDPLLMPAMRVTLPPIAE